MMLLIYRLKAGLVNKIIPDANIQNFSIQNNYVKNVTGDWYLELAARQNEIGDSWLAIRRKQKKEFVLYLSDLYRLPSAGYL
jgi:hypothetical protein